jgi:hypothetical protein
MSRAVDVILGPGESTASADASISDSVLEFGGTKVHDRIAKTVTITNDGTSLLRIPRSSLRLAGKDPGQFSVSRYPGNLGVGAEGTVEVTYAPAAAGDHEATLEIELASGAQSVSLHGQAT